MEVGHHKAVEDFAEAQSLALYATGRVADDGIIDPRIPAPPSPWRCPPATQRRSEGADGYGVFRL